MTVNTSMLGVDRLLPFLGKYELRFLGLTSFKALKNNPLQAMDRHFFRIGVLRLLDKVRRLLYRFDAILSIQAFSVLLTSYSLPLHLFWRLLLGLCRLRCLFHHRSLGFLLSFRLVQLRFRIRSLYRVL